MESGAPGEVRSADAFSPDNLKGIGKVDLRAVVDPDSSHAFGFLHVSKQPKVVVAVPPNEYPLTGSAICR